MILTLSCVNHFLLFVVLQSLQMRSGVVIFPLVLHNWGKKKKTVLAECFHGRSLSYYSCWTFILWNNGLN